MEYNITGRTRLGCLLGTPVSHSISPMMYNETFRLLGLDLVYLCFDTKEADLGSLVRSLREMNVFGFNLTMPDKERILPYLDDLTPAARMIGAVNTVKNENGRLIGHNTDGVGYIRSLRDFSCPVKGIEMTLLGAGGAASSIAIQAALDGVSVLHIVNRKGRSVGMAPDTNHSPLEDSSWLHPGLFVSDVIYNPRQTLLLREASGRGCSTGNGMYMLLYQGEAAFHFWTGLNMPVEEIRKKFFTE